MHCMRFPWQSLVWKIILGIVSSNSNGFRVHGLSSLFKCMPRIISSKIISELAFIYWRQYQFAHILHLMMMNALSRRSYESKCSWFDQRECLSESDGRPTVYVLNLRSKPSGCTQCEISTKAKSTHSGHRSQKWELQSIKKWCFQSESIREWHATITILAKIF